VLDSPRYNGKRVRILAIHKSLDTISYFPLFHIGEEIEVEEEGETEEGAFDDDAAGDVELDEIVGGEGGI